jgi:hypothetical protein
MLISDIHGLAMFTHVYHEPLPQKNSHQLGKNTKHGEALCFQSSSRPPTPQANTLTWRAIHPSHLTKNEK